MATFTAERTARKPHQCARCGGAIRPGERYASISWPPGGEMGYLGWSRIAEHLGWTACESALDAAARHIPDTPDGDLSDWPVPVDADGLYVGEARED